MDKLTEKINLKAELETLKNELEDLNTAKDELEMDYTAYDEALDEQGDIKIGNLSYSPSYVLKNVDEIAYRTGFNEFIDEKTSELESEIADKESEIEEKQTQIDAI